jgi:hypothetical protein
MRIGNLLVRAFRRLLIVNYCGVGLDWKLRVFRCPFRNQNNGFALQTTNYLTGRIIGQLEWVLAAGAVDNEHDEDSKVRHHAGADPIGGSFDFNLT